MEQRKAVMDIANMVRASSMSNHRCQDLVKRAEKVANDTDKEARIKAQLCKACHYFGRIGGQAFTMRPCMSCGSEEQYSSTATDVLCKSCAKDGGLCKTARTNWSTLAEPHVCELMLGHVLPGVWQVYDRHDYLEEQADAYRKWYARVMGIVHADTV